MWNSLDADPFKKGALYAVGTMYKSDDFRPYIYRTEDYGKTWTLITNGITTTDFARVVRADQKRQGLLYCGTEYGMYVSFDHGNNWKRMQLNLPIVPITDLTIKENDLIVATQGRAFYVLDDLSVLQQMNAAILNKNLHVFDVTAGYRMPGNSFSQTFSTPRNAGTNPPSSVIINYFIKEANDSTKGAITVFDKEHKEIKTWTTDSKENNTRVDLTKGMNQFYWDLRYPEADKVEGMILWNGVPGAIVAPPGNYFAKLKVGKDSTEVPFTVKPDPNYKVTPQEYDTQFAFLKQVRDKFNDIQKAIKDIRSLRNQINSFVGMQGKDMPKEVKQMADSINKGLTSIEETLYQTRSKSGQDVLNYPIRLNDKLAGVFDVANSGNFPPSKQVLEVYNDLSAQIDMQLKKLEQIKNKDIPAFNDLIRQKALPVIGVKSA